MEHNRSCVLPSNVPAFTEHETVIPSRILQDRSGNQRHTYVDTSLSWKRSPSTPIENIYSHGLGGGFIAGSLLAQLNSEKTEEHIAHEARRLMGLLIRCDKYKKYRERQPTTQKEKELIWPDNLEEAFFRGLIRWPPMGRRKLMLDGQLRGRNELVANSITKDTGELRGRKQVSSHIQVLKNICQDQPQILVYMSKEDLGTRKRSHLGQLRSRHQPVAQVTKRNYDSQGGIESWPGYGSLSSSRMLATLEPPFAVTNFSIVVHRQGQEQATHCLTQLAPSPRLGDIKFTENKSWHNQYPELRFLSTDGWKERQILVCDASIKVMTERGPQDGMLSVNYYIQSQDDLSHLKPLHCKTRFYDRGEIQDQLEKISGKEKVVKETVGECEFSPDTGHATMTFGSRFWSRRTTLLGEKLRRARMTEDRLQQSRLEIKVRREVQDMTAVQDVYGVNKDTGETHCFLTILWRFELTRTSHESGKTTWRVAKFTPPPLSMPQTWIKDELESMKDLKTILNSTGEESPPSGYPPLPLDLSHPTFVHHPPALDLDSLSHMGLDNLDDFSNPNSASAPSLSIDYSQTQSLASLTHSQDANGAHHQSHDFLEPNDLDFHGGHINLRFLEPAINFGTYENYASMHPIAPPLSSIPGLDQGADTTFDLGLGVNLTNCFSHKPWPYNDLIARLEGAAEQSNDLSMLGQTTCEQEDNMVGHGVLHSNDITHGLWKLQSEFGDDTGVGASDLRKDSVAETGDGGLLDFSGWREK
ncbi:TEA/ATTS domain family-domain-containing protein [Dendryphion nanum]|uniref:TEA/ATTS domain family-domain-containing protein n=1 Tax=Dendryphion nanum TaxID=256645 RepID=A0A9P9EIK1_9PLEO|nr:TEA/ATTS domain family-domain-containing protein [Dendryphion nanum]